MLAISTATKKALIAIDVDGKKFYSELEANCHQSEKMMVEIHKILTNNSITLDQVGNFALVIGPGSFTGLRIGAALIKGFCAGLPDKKVVPIPTLELMAKQVIKDFKPKASFSCFLNAQSGLYYTADFNSKGKKINEEHLIENSDILKGKGAKFCLVEESFLSLGVDISCETLLETALDYEKNGQFISAKDLSVKYIRRSSAEE